MLIVVFFVILQSHNSSLQTKMETRLILMSEGQLLTCECGPSLSLPLEMPAGVSVIPDTLTFNIDQSGHHYRAMSVERGPELADPYGFIGLRAAYPRMEEADYRAAGKAAELMHWDAGSRYCGACGAPMRRSTEISKICTACGREVFAQVSPAIIVLVRRGREALLVHARNFSRPFFGLVAGFVETGESLEQCVRREVMEETSLRVKNIRYAGSQPWPYPNSLMLGFTADYESGELRFADGELSEGGFFSADNLPLLPTPPSIARRLIEEWIAEIKK